jgi:hypothetical protein
VTYKPQKERAAAARQALREFAQFHLARLGMGDGRWASGGCTNRRVAALPLQQQQQAAGSRERRAAQGASSGLVVGVFIIERRYAYFFV